MSAMAQETSGTIRLVTDSERGQRIQARLDALGMTARQFQERTSISRDTLRKAVAGEASVRPNTYDLIESKLDQFERQAEGFEGLKASDPSEDLVEFELSGNFGVRVVVKGPIRDAEALEASVARLIREMGRDTDR